MRNFLKITSIMMLGAAVLFTGCKKDKEEKFSVTLSVNDPAMGTVVGGGEFAEGTEIAIVATPTDGYVFQKWSDGITDNPRKLVVTQNVALTALFAENNGGQGGQGGGDGEPQSITLSGTINENTTWKDLGLPVDYIVDGLIYLEGNALVTVDPGVTIMFTGTNGGISVGENAGLKMVGTATKPIIFTGPTNNQNVGAWDYISIASNRSENIWENVTFKNGGSTPDGAVVWIEPDAKVSMKNCIIDGSLANGIIVRGNAVFAAFEGNTITNCAKNPIFIDSWKSVTTLNANNIFATNGNNTIAISDGSWAFENSDKNTLKKMPVPYYLKETLRLGGSQTFTIEAGTVIKMASSIGIEIGEDVTFIAEGTATEPIEISGFENEKSYWESVWYESKKSNSSIKYVNFKNAGKGDENAAILEFYNGTKLTMENCSFSETEGFGIKIGDATSMKNVSITGDTYSNCDGGNVKVIDAFEKEDENGEWQTIISEGQTFDNFAAVKAAME